MIRESGLEDLDAIMQIWLESNIEAHFFIPTEYWKQNLDSVKEAIAEGVTIFEDDGNVKGFIGIRDGYIAGIFVKKDSRALGIGKMLIDEVKRSYDSLELDVYLKNTQAIKFYMREDFIILKKQVNEDTGYEEYHMGWKCEKSF